MRPFYLVLFLFLTVETLSFGALAPLTVSRVPLRRYVTEGIYEGGGRTAGNIERMRLSNRGSVERWTIDFSTADKKKPTLPRFRIRYVAGDTVYSSDGTPVHEKPSRFVIQMQHIQRNRLLPEDLQAAVERSALVREIVVYPQVEQGDLAMEIVLRQPVSFEPYQPIEHPNRLVLDLKPNR